MAAAPYQYTGSSDGKVKELEAWPAMHVSVYSHHVFPFQAHIQLHMESIRAFATADAMADALRQLFQGHKDDLQSLQDDKEFMLQEKLSFLLSKKNRRHIVSSAWGNINNVSIQLKSENLVKFFNITVFWLGDLFKAYEEWYSLPPEKCVKPNSTVEYSLCSNFSCWSINRRSSFFASKTKVRYCSHDLPKEVQTPYIIFDTCGKNKTVRKAQSWVAAPCPSLSWMEASQLCKAAVAVLPTILSRSALMNLIAVLRISKISARTITHGVFIGVNPKVSDVDMTSERAERVIFAQRSPQAENKFFE